MGQHVLITGTNSGFGRLSALTLAGKGHTVFATMRDIKGRNQQAAALLESEGGGHVKVVEMNLACDALVDEAVRSILGQAGHIDVIVNNAGSAAMGLEETLTPEQTREMFDINVLAPHRILRAALPSMRARKSGLIVQISSGFGRMVMPLMGVYCASKAALEAMSDAYRYELKPTGVEVTILQPGPFPTNIGRSAVIGENQDRAVGYGPFSNGLEMMNAHFQKMFSGPNVPNPQDVADAVLSLVEMPEGTRPVRLVVDAMTGTWVEGVNRVHADTQKRMLGLMGMGMLNDD